MKFLDNLEIQNWCESRALLANADGRLYYDLERFYCLTIGLDIKKPENLVGLASRLVLMAHDYTYNGALLWVTQRDIWPDYSEKTGAKMIELMRLARGETAQLEDRPGHLFGPDDYYEMQSYLLLPLLFGWDAFIVPEGEDYFVFISHDSVVAVVSRTPEVHESRRTYLANWHPRDDDWYRKFYVE